MWVHMISQCGAHIWQVVVTGQSRGYVLDLLDGLNAVCIMATDLPSPGLVVTRARVTTGQPTDAGP